MGGVSLTTEELKAAILKEKQENGTYILAHTYQSPDIIDIADFTGDSYALSTAATKCANRRVILCGVRFMAETVKILSPEKEVILPVYEATCPMAEQIAPERVRAFKEENPNACVIAYINTTAQLKAECDVCVTSSSAVKIVSALPQKDILFIPDRNLGSWVKKQVPDKNFIFWNGFCSVHSSLSIDDVKRAKAEHPHAKLAVHPECIPEISAAADFVGATSAIINYCRASNDAVIIGTEHNVYDYLTREMPERELYQLAPEKLTCADMAMTTLESVYLALKGEGGKRVEVDEPLRSRAKRSIDNMLKYGG